MAMNEPAALQVGNIDEKVMPKQGWAALKRAAREVPAEEVKRRATRFWPLIAAATLVFAFPLYVLALATALTVAECVVIAWALGYARLSRMVVAQFRDIQAKDPHHAEVLRQRAIRIAGLIGWVISLLPTGWTRGLYLPDFEEPEEEPKVFALDPFARLEPMA